MANSTLMVTKGLRSFHYVGVLNLLSLVEVGEDGFRQDTYFLGDSCLCEPPLKLELNSPFSLGKYCMCSDTNADSFKFKVMTTAWL